MFQKEKLKKGTSNQTDLEFEKHVELILNKMTGNAYFPSPLPPLVQISDNNKHFSDLLLAIASGNYTRSQIDDKDKTRKAIDAQLGRLLGYVNGVAGENMTIGTSSGFPLAEEKKPVGDLGAPQNFTARSLATGSVTLKCKKLRGADSYMFQYTTSPNPEVENWINITTTVCRMVIDDLTPGVQYKFRVCGVGAKGAGQWAMANCYVNF